LSGGRTPEPTRQRCYNDKNMCGIAGIISRIPVDGAPIAARRFSSSLAHRGPDGEGYSTIDGDRSRFYEKPHSIPSETRVLLCHRRLAILDLSELGRQPYSSKNGRYWMVYNGEVYNYVELRDQLIGLGHRFHSNSDTEVVLACYEQWGAESIKLLVGMFAFVIVDTEKQIAFLARDPFGIKPIYYAHWKEALVFASEIKALHPYFRKEVPDLAVVRDYLIHSETDTSERTFYQDVQQIKPAHCATVAMNMPWVVKQQAYWAPTTTVTRPMITAESAVKEITKLINTSVAMHMRSDVPVACAVSGGLDSSVIACVANSVLPAGGRLDTFTYTATGSEYDEQKFADIITRQINGNPHYITFDPIDIVNDFAQFTAIQDEPVTSASMYAQYRVFKAVAEAGIKVVLDGQGGDELFAGYTHHLPPRIATLLLAGRYAEAMALLRAYKQYPDASYLSGFAQALRLIPLPQRISKGLAWVEQFRLRNKASRWFEARETASRPEPIRSRECLKTALRQSLLQTSMPRLLRFQDRSSMACSVESRVPYLIHPLANYTMGLDEELFIQSEGTRKALLVAAASNFVPRKITERRDKLGFNIPEKRFYTQMTNWTNQVLSSNVAKSIPFCDQAVLIKNASLFISSFRTIDRQTWRWLSLIKWCELNQTNFEAP